MSAPELHLVVPLEGVPRIEFVGLDPDDREQWLRLQGWLSAPAAARMLRLLAEFVTPPEWSLDDP